MASSLCHIFGTRLTMAEVNSAVDRQSGNCGLKRGIRLVTTSRFTSRALLLAAATPLALVLSMAPGYAQDAAPAAGSPATAAPQTPASADESGQDIVVTGSIIRGTDLGISPLPR